MNSNSPTPNSDLRPPTSDLRYSNRQFAPDLLKASAIFGVVYIHTQPRFDNVWTQALSDLSRAAVPCFIILFAYFFEKSLLKGRPPVLYTLQRWSHIALVFTIWSTFYLFLKESWTMPTLLSWLVRHYSGGAWPGQYFFMILLQLVPLFLVLRWIYGVRWLRWCCLAAVVLLYFAIGYRYDTFPFIFQKLNIRPFIYHIPYIFAGIALARGTFPRLHSWLGISVFLIPLEFLILSHLRLEHGHYITPTVLASSILLSGTILRSNAPPPRHQWIRRVIEPVSRNTLTIFVANPIVLAIIFWATRPIRPEEMTIIEKIALSLVTASASVALCLALAWIIRKIRLEGVLN